MSQRRLLALLVLISPRLLAGAMPQTAEPSLAPDQSHLPRVERLLQQVRVSQAKVVAAQRRYLCKQTVSVTQLSADYDGRTTDTARFETFYVNGNPIDRLLEHNGLSLTPSQQEAEEIRVSHEIEAAFQRRPGQIDWDNTMGGLILARSRLTHERRILVESRPVISLRIEPHHTSGAHSAMDYVAESLQGEIWIDEEDSVLRRLDARAPGNVVFSQDLLVPKGFPVACYQSARLNDGAYVLQNWCGTMLPSIYIGIKDPVGVWNHRVKRKEYRFDGCRAFHSDARVLESATP